MSPVQILKTLKRQRVELDAMIQVLELEQKPKTRKKAEPKNDFEELRKSYATGSWKKPKELLAATNKKKHN